MQLQLVYNFKNTATEFWAKELNARIRTPLLHLLMMSESWLFSLHCLQTYLHRHICCTDASLRRPQCVIIVHDM